jgi:hypothetical protein
LQEWDEWLPDPAQTCRQCYVSLGRDPIDKAISLYQWRHRHGHIPKTQTLAEWLGLLADPEAMSVNRGVPYKTRFNKHSIHRDDQYKGFYSWVNQICGMHPNCYRFNTHGDWIFQRATENVVKHYAVIGVIERMDEFLREGVRVFPQYFGEGDIPHTNKRPVSRNAQLAKQEERRTALQYYPKRLLELEVRGYVVQTVCNQGLR